MPLTCETVLDGGTLVLSMSGSVDGACVALVAATIEVALAVAPENLVIDLGGLRFCGVRVLALLVDCRAAAARHGVGFALSAAPRHVDRALHRLWSSAELPVLHRDASAAASAWRQRPTCER